MGTPRINESNTQNLPCNWDVALFTYRNSRYVATFYSSLLPSASSIQNIWSEPDLLRGMLEKANIHKF
jgi:hypothetical protein